MTIIEKTIDVEVTYTELLEFINEKMNKEYNPEKVSGITFENYQITGIFTIEFDE